MRFSFPEKLLGIMIAIIASFVVWLATADALSSILVALVIELIALTMETQIELSHSTKAIADILSISEASATLAPLREAVENYDSIVRNGKPLHKQEANRRLLEFGDMIKDLRNGRISIPAEEAYVRAGQILDTLQKNMLATDVVMDPNKWILGDHSLWQEANLRIARKGLKMTRIFILKDKDYLRDEYPLSRIMREQSGAGISIRYVTIDELEPELIRDGAILDDSMVITSLFTPAGEYGLLRLETSNAVVEDSLRCFERTLARSYPFENNASSGNK